MSGNLFIISAASGTGKTSLIKHLLNQMQDVKVSISHTTRPARSGEQHGINYHFIDQSEFSDMQHQDLFLEHAEVFGYYYGTSTTWVQSTLNNHQDVILEIDWQGAQQVRSLMPSAISVFILPPSLETLQKRLQQRNQDSQAVIQKRLSEAQLEISHYNEYDYIIINDHFEQAAKELGNIIQTARFRRSAIQSKYQTLINRLLNTEYHSNL